MRLRPTKVAGVALLLLGVILLLYSIFGTERRRQSADLGPLEIEVVESERPDLSPWIGVALAAVGAALLLVPARGRS
jgi:drug/metabolite transporter (DMT)-like permease